MELGHSLISQQSCSLEIFIFPNGMVAVCKGEKQVPMLQGRWSEKKKILLPMIEKYQDIIVHGNINQSKQKWEIEKYGDN